MLLLLGWGAGCNDGLGLVLVQLSSGSLVGRGSSNGSSLLDGLDGLSDGLVLLDRNGSKTSLGLPLLSGGRLELLDKGAEDGSTLGGLGLLGGSSGGNSGLLSFGSLLDGNGRYGGSGLSSGLGGLDNIVGVDGSSGGD